MEPFLPTLTAIALRLFTTATAAITAGATPTPAAGGSSSSQEAAGAGDRAEEASKGKQQRQGAEGAEEEEEEEEDGGKEVPALERHREVRGSALRLFAQVSADAPPLMRKKERELSSGSQCAACLTSTATSSHAAGRTCYHYGLRGKRGLNYRGSLPVLDSTSRCSCASPPRPRATTTRCGGCCCRRCSPWCRDSCWRRAAQGGYSVERRKNS